MITDQFSVSPRLKSTGLILIIIGIAAILLGIYQFLLRDGHTELDVAHFWIILLQNSVYFLMISVASIFILAASALAQGSWIVTYRRVPEAIGANVWLFGLITLIILFSIVFGFSHHNPIYHWVHPEGDKILEGKRAFLNPAMYVGFSVVTVALWSYFGIKFRNLSLAQEKAPFNSTKIYWKVITLGGAFLLLYALTMMSTTPWIWLMSIEAHWYSTLYSWNVFSSSFVSGMALILLWTVYLKNKGNLMLVTKEHMHDLGKFMFAFSIFWAYTWFAQYMLLWYGNIPEETTYFKIRQQGPYGFLFYAQFIICFIMPILILMSAPSKRNYFTIVFMAMAIIFGHWIYFFLMAVPGPLGANYEISWYEIGVLLGFVGVMILAVSSTLAKASLVPYNNPMLKESIIHLS